MIGKKHKDIAQWAMEFAIANGAEEAKVALYEGVNSSYSLRDAKVETLEQASEMSLGLQVYVHGKFGSFSTNSLHRGRLESFIRNGIEATQFLAEDRARKLPSPERYYKGGKPDLDLYDASFENIHPDTKIGIAQAVATEVLGKDKRVLSVSSSYVDGESSSYLLASNGFEGATSRSWYSVSASVSIKGEGDSRPSDYWYDSSLFYDQLKPVGVGTRALSRVLKKIGQRKVKTGKYTMVVDAVTAPRLLGPLLSATYGSAIQQQNSFLIDQLNKKIGSDLLTLYDNPHLPRSNGSRYFDGEGVATQSREVFSSGVLNTFFINTYIANKLTMQPTISGPSLLEMKLGSQDLVALISSVSDGILVTGFNGGNSNSSTGDFSFGIEGFLIEHGCVSHPISEMNITGNMIELWDSLVAVGNDPILSSSWRIPSLVFENVKFSGL